MGESQPFAAPGISQTGSAWHWPKGGALEIKRLILMLFNQYWRSRRGRGLVSCKNIGRLGGLTIRVARRRVPRDFVREER
jgi:hypothetical protein